MKTASKFLSMLLLVALCLSLMGGSAYALAPLGGEGELMSLEPMDELPTASDPNAVGSSGSIDSGSTSLMTLEPVDGLDTYTSDVELNSLEVMPLTAETNIWDGLYPNLETAISSTAANGTITLHKDVKTDPVEDKGAIVNKNITIDLGGKTLKLTGALTVNANVTLTLTNGKIDPASRIVVVKGGTLNVQSNATVPPDVIQSEGTVGSVGTCVATVNGKNFDTVQGALDYAATLTGAVTINFPNNTDQLGALTFDAWPSMQCSSLTLNLNANELTGKDGANILVMKPTTINGSNAAVNGMVTVSGSTLTVNSGVTMSQVGVGQTGGGTITINGGTVTDLRLFDATLNMPQGTIGTLTVEDASRAGTLNVSGGTVNKLAVTTTQYPKQAITGGTWTVGADEKQFFEGSLKTGYYLTGSNPYTVTSNGGTVVNPGPGGNTGSDGSFTYTVYGSPYTKNSNGSIYIDISALSDNGYYWIGTNANATGARQLGSADYSLVSNGSGYRLTLSNSYLNRLAAGTYYGFVTYNGNTARMGSFVVTDSGMIYPSGDVAVWPVNENTWYSGDPLLTFYYKPAINEKGIMIDGWTVPGIDWVDNHMGTLKLGSNILNNLSRGWHTLTINTDSGIASCNFFIGATLKPVDTDKHVLGSSKNLQFVCTDPISRVWVGPNELTNSFYGDYFSLSSSGKTITLSSKFLNDRAAGTYTLTVQTSNGDQPSCTFQILTRAQASSSPRTGDESNLGLWAAVLLVSGAAGVAILPRLRKNEH